MVLNIIENFNHFCGVYLALNMANFQYLYLGIKNRLSYGEIS